jgi:hypothetical protein
MQAILDIKFGQEHPHRPTPSLLLPFLHYQRTSAYSEDQTLIPKRRHKALDCVNSCRFSSNRSRLLALNEISTLSNTAVLCEVQIQAAVIPSRAKHNNAERQSRNKKHIQDTKEHETISDSDLVPAIIKTVRNWVQKPEENCPACEHDIVALNAQTLGGQEARVKEGSSKQEVGKGAVGEEAPFVVCGCHGA